MNNPNVAITNTENVCFKCINKADGVRVINIHQMGWGSGFDGWGTELQLCGSCYSDTNPDWWELEVVNCGDEDWHGSEYKYENEIFEYIGQLPLAGKELVYNRFSNGWNSRNYWDSQDYIDYQLGILPHDKCKEYSVYSHDEIKAYRERFPKCQHPVNVIYNDESKGCRCPFGAFGKYGQQADEYNIWDACYKCEFYSERETPIRDIEDDDYEDYKIYSKVKLKEKVLKEKFE